MTTASTQALDHAALEMLCSEMLRSTTARADLHWSTQTLFAGTQALAARGLHVKAVADDLAEWRALTDSASLRLMLSDEAVFEQTAPDPPMARMIFDWLEQLRTDSLAGEHYPGMRDNLQAHFDRWSRAFVDSGLTETDIGLLLLTIGWSVWSRLCAIEPDPEFADLIESTRAGLGPALGPHLLALRRLRHEQRAYAEPARTIAQWAGEALQSAQQAQAGRAVVRSRNGFALPLSSDAIALPPLPVAQTDTSQAWEAANRQYRVYTRQYDAELPAQSLVRRALLVELRAKMDEELQHAHFRIAHLVRFFRAQLLRPAEPHWVFEREQGYVDPRRLAPMLAHPERTDIFREWLPLPKVQCAVTFLIDCSGSMKAHAQALSLMVDVLGRALMRAGAAVEVLGFSTGSWNGGRARRDWQRAGCPTLPGRLNERLHLVFKGFDEPWRQARHGIAALRKPDLFREGLDGEALQWACERSLALDVPRRLVVVVSDGCPMDTATQQANDGHFLEQHLRAVVQQASARGDIEIGGLGVGLDLGVFYRHRLGLDLDEGLSEDSLLAIAQWMVAPRRGRTRAP